MKKSLAVLVTALSMYGCAVMATIETSAKTAVFLYCDAPQKLRAVNRSLVDSVVKPNKIEIICDGDA